VKLAVLAALVLALGAGCAGDSSSDTTTTAAETTPVRIYLLRDGKVWPVRRDVVLDDGLPNRLVLDELRRGPTKDEQELGLTTEVPADGSEAGSRAALAQLTYTLTQPELFGPVADVDGRELTRADFEDETPAILVESPLAFESVESPLQATGTANTFEANFEYELADTDGKVVDSHFVTATSGTGTRGTFDFTTKPYGVPFDGVGALIVFERSAKDGSRINLVEIPVRMTR
jgi:hypothetical protein